MYVHRSFGNIIIIIILNIYDFYHIKPFWKKRRESLYRLKMPLGFFFLRIIIYSVQISDSLSFSTPLQRHFSTGHYDSRVHIGSEIIFVTSLYKHACSVARYTWVRCVQIPRAPFARETVLPIVKIFFALLFLTCIMMAVIGYYLFNKFHTLQVPTIISTV